jgi:hypothetical protein
MKVRIPGFTTDKLPADTQFLALGKNWQGGWKVIAGGINEPHAMENGLKAQKAVAAFGGKVFDVKVVPITPELRSEWCREEEKE